MDTLDLDYTSIVDFSAQAPIFGTRVLDEISKIDNNESREILLKLSKAEVKVSKLAAACKARDSEIARLEKVNADLKNLLKSTDIEEISLQLQHMQYLNKALEQKFQESQIKIYNLEKNEKKELKELKFKTDELEKDKKYLEDANLDLKDQISMLEYERNYLQSRNNTLEKRLKALETQVENEEFEPSPKKNVKERSSTSNSSLKSSLSSALKLFQEFPLSRNQ
jgi:chromosome segregation ATPase